MKVHISIPQALTIDQAFKRALEAQAPKVHIVKPFQVERKGSTAHFPRMDAEKQPEMVKYRNFLEGFDGGRKNAQVGWFTINKEIQV